MANILELTEEQMVKVLLAGQSAQIAGAPLSDNPHASKYDSRRATWTKGYLKAEQNALGPVDPITGAPIL